MPHINSENVAAASSIIEAAARSGLQADVVENPRTAAAPPLNAEQTDLLSHVGDMRHGLGEMIAELGDTDADKRWLGIAATHLQQGMMAVERAVINDRTKF